MRHTSPRVLILLAITTVLTACAGHPMAHTPPQTAVTSGSQPSTPPSPPPHPPAAEDHPAPVRVYGAAWCAPCHELQRQLIARDIAFETIDVDARPDLWQAALAWTDFPAMPLTRVPSGALVAWIEGVHADRIQTARDAPSPPTPMLWFVHQNGWTNVVLPDDATRSVEVWSNVGVPASAVADATRVMQMRVRDRDPQHAATPLPTTALEVCEVAPDGGTSLAPLTLASRGRPPFEWDDQATDELETALLLHSEEHLGLGYLKQELSSARVAPAPGGGGLAITVVETLGLRSRLGGIEVIERDRRWGNRVPPLASPEAMRALFHLRDGHWAGVAELRGGLEAVRRVYLEAGYARLVDDVETIDEANAAPGEARTRFVVTLVRGPVVHIARIDVTTRGVGTTVGEIRKRIGLQPGEVERPSRLESARAKLLSSGVARHVAVSTTSAPGGDVVHFELDSDDDVSPIDVASSE